ncbi:MAG: putative bifunctional diguanylate cyclase/phosphodiesterase [Phycisphaeraceae bacterium]
MKRTQKVLVIDDDAAVHRLVKVRLGKLDVDVLAATDGAAGLAAARQQAPDLILLDVAMPGMDGFEVCRRLRDHAVTCEIPVIFLTGSDNSEEKSRGFELGASDYVTKPFDAAELNARVRAALRTQALVEALETQARTDALTGLPNRAALHRRLTQYLDQHREDTQHALAILFIDLDRFKVINDSLGHGIGDQLLIEVADLLCTESRHMAEEGVLESVPFVARMGGDEFTILIERVRDSNSAVAVGERLCAALQAPRELSGYHVTIGGSIGVRLCDHDCDDVDMLLRDSDTAMYRAKAEGKGRCVLFDQKMLAHARERLQLEHDLHHALDNDQFELHYQPIIDLRNRRLRSLEALLRWRHPEQGLVGPDEFIPIAEETGLIRTIGRWVLRRACQQLNEWVQNGAIDAGTAINVNLSKVQVQELDLPETMHEIVRECGMTPSHVQLEITESAIMQDMQLVIPVLEQLHECGFILAMDDFGKGYSSLASLHRFPIDLLKIDRQFVDVMTQSRAHIAVVNAIITLADNLGMAVVAEGIETDGHLVQLQTLDCAYGQGHLFCRPQPPSRLEPLLRSWRGVTAEKRSAR